ncbi:stage II sporulation protein M, partial [Mesorhizobium sp.]
LYDGADNQFLSSFAAYLFTHNTQVAILAFALGFAFAVPSVLIILMNGCMLGAIFQIYAAKGLGFELGGWLSIHGTTELFAIALAGAAGMRIGTRIAFPGELTRMAAAAQAGRIAATAMVGVVVMLLFAGLLEGIGRQTITGDGARYAIGGGMLALWCAYFYLLRIVRHGDG